MSSPESNTLDPAIFTEIETYAVEAMARFGAPGQVHIEGDDLVLEGPTGTTRTELGRLPYNWSELPDEARRRRSGELVRRLLGQRAAPTPRKAGPSVPFWIWLILAGTAAAVGAAVVGLKAPREPDPGVIRRKGGASAASSEAAENRQQRAARVCETTRARVARGGTVGTTDVEGWVVDAFVLKRGATEPLDTNPALSFFVKNPADPNGTSFIWRDEPALVALASSDTRVVVTRELIQGESAERIPGVRLTFEGLLTDPYFDPDKRRSYFHIVNSLTDALGGTHAGLFARCVDGTTHHVGSWFRGNTPGDAATSLVYMLGTYSSPPHLADPFLHPPTKTDIDRAHAFLSIQDAESKLDQRAIATILGRNNGMISGPAGGPYIITFAFTDSNRGARASRDLARATSIGSGN